MCSPWVSVAEEVQEKRPWELLVVDDSRGDAALLCLALRQWKSSLRVNVLEDSGQALQYLRKEGRFADAHRPDLIILDLHLPPKDGIEVLKEIREDARLQLTPVVMITTSDARRDVERAYVYHVNSYITKTSDADRYFDKIRALAEYWFSAVQLPTDDKLI